MNYLRKIYNAVSNKLLFGVFVLIALGLIMFLASPIIWIWAGWGLGWRIGVTGLGLAITSFAAWWFIYNLYCTTRDTIYDDNKEEIQ